MIKIFTNEVAGGWSPDEIESSLGGSEEAVVSLASELISHDKVIVYHSQKEKKDIYYKDVLYLDRLKAECHEDDTFITFKDKTPWINGAKCKKKIHWSCEVEKPWDTKGIDHFVHISEFHQSRNSWVDPLISKYINLGVDTNSLNFNRVEKEDNSVLYCSSPDRGLDVLLKDWREIKNNFPDLKLKVAYGFSNLLACSNNNHVAINYRDRLLEEMDKQEIIYLGQLTKDQIEKEYWRAKYWILPLQRAESELFCLNAVKSRYCGAIPIVNKIGALKNTVGKFIDYKSFVQGSTETSDLDEGCVKPSRWYQIFKENWLPLL